MDASAYFSSGPPTQQQQQSGYPPRAPNQQQQYGSNSGQQGQVAANNNSYGQVCTRKKYELLDVCLFGLYNISVLCILVVYISQSIMAYCFIYPRPQIFSHTQNFLLSFLLLQSLIIS